MLSLPKENGASICSELVVNVGVQSGSLGPALTMLLALAGVSLRCHFGLCYVREQTGPGVGVSERGI